MNGTILDFLKLAEQNPDLARELATLATKHGFEFSDEVRDADLEDVSGGALAQATQRNVESKEPELQNALQQQQHTLQMLSNVSKMVSDTQKSIIRNIG